MLRRKKKKTPPKKNQQKGQRDLLCLKRNARLHQILVSNSSYHTWVFYLKAFLFFQYLLDLNFSGAKPWAKSHRKPGNKRTKCPPTLLSKLGKVCAAPPWTSTSLRKRNENPVDSSKCWCIFFPAFFWRMQEPPGCIGERNSSYQHLVPWWCNEPPGQVQRWPTRRRRYDFCD